MGQKLKSLIKTVKPGQPTENDVFLKYFLLIYT